MGIIKGFASSELGGRLLRDEVFRTRIALHLSLAWNLFIALFKLFTGIRADSKWLIAFGSYYLVLAALRYALARADRRLVDEGDIRSEWARYRGTGFVLLAIDAALTVLVIQAAALESVDAYPGHLIFLMALYAFYAVISACVNLHRFRRLNSPLLSAIKAVSLTTALTAMLSLEVAMTARFGGDAHAFRSAMNAATGGTVCAVVLGMAIYMIVRSTRRIKQF